MPQRISRRIPSNWLISWRITGIQPGQPAARVGSDRLRHRGLIDYVVQNEPLLLAICQSAISLSPETVMRVWAKLNPAG